MPVTLRENETCGISGNGLRKLILLELGEFEYVGDCDIVVSCNATPELVWKLELAADHESPAVSDEVRLGSSVDT